MLPQAQATAVALWVAANPGAVIKPKGIAEGGLPAYIRKPTGKRADINRMFTEGVTVGEFLAKARKLGGGYTDLVAGLAGGYSPSASTYGLPAITLEA
jgi:hypothetical protein|tara:strand:- start:32 stop:325 length:294 start_codon:yes stop_codon:yes gene_type:complete